MKVVVHGDFDLNRIASAAPGFDVVAAKDTTDLLRETADAEVVLGVRPDSFAELLRKSKKLRWAHTSTAGVDRYICDELRAGTVVLTCAKDGPAGPNLADHAMALLLALSRNIGRAARSSTWLRADFSAGVFELSGKSALIAGYGAAGREIAVRAHSFGLNVVATKRTPPYGRDGDTAVHPPKDLGDLAGAADIVFNALPGTPDTQKLFNASLFSRFKAGAIFINVGRGTTVDTESLVTALENGRLRGAGLDVVDPEPLPDGHPLWAMENVIITPHIAGVASQRAERNMQLIEENFRRLAAGKAFKSAVDPEAGY